jgi:hypothetical protein
MIEKQIPQDPSLSPAEEVGLPDSPNENTIVIELEDGSAEINLGEDTPEPGEFDANLAETLDEGVLATLGAELVELVEADDNSNKDWKEAFIKGMEMLGMRYEERTDPWIGACGVYSTILSEAAIRFQSESIMETFPAAGPVKTEIIGEETPDKAEAAVRVRDDMNYRITEEMTEYRPEHERLLYSLGLAGAAFKKVYFDTALNRQTSIFCPAEDIIIPYGASSAQTAERVTHMMRKTKNELKKLQVSGFYVDCDLGDPAPTNTDIEKKKAEQHGVKIIDDNRYRFYETQFEYDLPGYEDPDGIALPYIATVDKGTGKVLAVYRNWEEKDKDRKKRQHLVQYTYIPGFGPYGWGLIHLIGGYARADTAITRELVDAGQLANLPGGMKTRGLRVKGDNTPISPGEWRDVDVSSGALRDNIMPLPYKEPSQTLLALRNQIVEEARRLGSISDMNISDMSANAPVGTTLALLERTLKTMSAVQARVHYSMKQEFKLLAAIIRDHTPAEYEYDPVDANRGAKQADYDLVEVIPVSDPNSATMAQRIMQYQAALQLAQGAPQIYDLPILHRQMLEVLGIKNANKLVPTDDDQTPKDPVSENMAFLNGTPVKAFIEQDHDAHICVHQTFMQDPMIAQTIGQNPMAQQMGAAIMAHISQHLGFSYRLKIQERLGATLPAPDAELPPEVEMQLSRVVAQAATQLLQMNKAGAAQAQAQQQAQDPLVQMQQQELQIKQAAQQTLAMKAKGDLDIRQGELMLKQREMQARSGQDPQAQQLQAQQAQQQQQVQAQQAGQQQQAAQQQAALKAQQMQQAQAHKQQAHGQVLNHKQQQHQMKLQQQQQAHQQKLDVAAQAAQQQQVVAEQAAEAAKAQGAANE